MKYTEAVTIKSCANLSDCNGYRYWLSRIWDESKPVGAFICINPSKATSIMCDLTLCNCNNLAAQWKWGGFYIVNLFAYRATNPEELENQSDPIGPQNDEAINYICSKVDTIVIAWGNRNMERAKEVLSSLRDKSLYCIAKNKGGGFLHPSRIKTEDYPCPTAI